VALSCVIVCSAGPQKVRAAEFLNRSVIFETKVLAHLDKGVPLDRFNVLLMSANPPKLGAEQEARFNIFTANGGVIIREGKAGRGLRHAPKPRPQDAASAYSPPSLLGG